VSGDEQVDTTRLRQGPVGVFVPFVVVGANCQVGSTSSLARVLRSTSAASTREGSVLPWHRHRGFPPDLMVDSASSPTLKLALDCTLAVRIIGFAYAQENASVRATDRVSDWSSRARRCCWPASQLFAHMFWPSTQGTLEPWSNTPARLRVASKLATKILATYLTIVVKS
jgi:hypothetical protein